MDNLVVASGDNVNLQIDWNDVFDSTSSNVNGNLYLTKIDLTSTSGGADNYTLTSNLKDLQQMKTQIIILLMIQQPALYIQVKKLL